MGEVYFGSLYYLRVCTIDAMVYRNGQNINKYIWSEYQKHTGCQRQRIGAQGDKFMQKSISVIIQNKECMSSIRI